MNLRKDYSNCLKKKGIKYVRVSYIQTQSEELLHLKDFSRAMIGSAAIQAGVILT